MRTAVRSLAALACALVAAGAAGAQQVKVETTETAEAIVRFHPHGFLTETELATLRLVATNKDVRAVFLPGGSGGFAALAVAPGEGFARDGQPVASATAVAGARDAAGAAADALAGCEAKRKKGPACVIVLEVAAK